MKRGLIEKTNIEPPTENRIATVNTSCPFSFNALKPQMNDITNSDDLTGGVRKWKRLAREEGNNNYNTVEMANQVCRRPILDMTDAGVKKKVCVKSGGFDNKENFQVVAGVQHHQIQ